MTEQLLYSNCELWAKFNPKQAVLLPYMEMEASGLSWTSTQKGELNLVKSTPQKSFYYHSIKNAANEASAWFKQLNLEGAGLLCVYGIGLGYYYHAAKEWLISDPSRQLVFLEDDLNVLHFFFQTETATTLLNDPQVQLLYFKDLAINDSVLERMYWNSAMASLVVSSLPLYADKKKEEYDNLHHKLSYDFALKNALIDEYLKYGARFFFNFYQNIHKLPGAYLGNKMYGQFKNVPAILCGAGPSLAKHLHLLPLLGEKALIFAGGSAMNALNAAGIQPHVGAGIDPNPAQLDRIKNNTAYEIPFFYRNRLNPEALDLIRGAHLYITGCGGYDVSQWYEEKLNISGEDLDEGHNVVNFCLQTATQLGCNPIIFIGVDLGFTDLKTYAPGIEDQVQFDINQTLQNQDFDSKPVLKTDIFDQPLYTLWKWIAESEWIGDFAKEHPDVTLINCTEGGLGFPGVVNRPFSEICEEYFCREHPITERLHGEIQNSLLKTATFPKVFHLTQELRQSLTKCDTHLTVLIEEAEENLRKVKETKTPLIHQSGYAALCEIELAEEPGYKYVIEMFNAIKTKVLEHEIVKGKFVSEFDYALKKIEVNIKRLTFLKEVALSNITLIDLALSHVKKTPRQKNILSTANLNSLMPPVENRENFHANYLPLKPKEGMTLPGNYIVRMSREYGQKNPRECRLEKEGLLEGQCILYYPNGKVKAEMFYQKGVLHGPATFFSSRNKLLSKSFFVEGKRQGSAFLYYAIGSLYARLEYLDGALHGIQHYYHPNGNLKSRLHYQKGVLIKAD